MTGFPLAWQVVDAPSSRLICEVRNLMPDPGDGTRLEEPNITIMTYAGDGLFSREEDVYNPLRFARMSVKWAQHRRGARQPQRRGPRVPRAVRLIAGLPRVWQAQPMKAAAKRIGLEIVGWTLLVVGIAALVLPGPGLLMMAGGIVLLSQQYEWAERRVEPIKREALKGAANVGRDLAADHRELDGDRCSSRRRASSGSSVRTSPELVAGRGPVVAARRQGDELLAVRLGRPRGRGCWCGATASSTATPRRSPRSRPRPSPTTTARGSGASASALRAERTSAASSSTTSSSGSGGPGGAGQRDPALGRGHDGAGQPSGTLRGYAGVAERRGQRPVPVGEHLPRHGLVPRVGRDRGRRDRAAGGVVAGLEHPPPPVGEDVQHV